MISINLLKRMTGGKKTKKAHGWGFRFAVIFVVGAGIVVAGVEIMRLLIIGPALQLSPIAKSKNVAPDSTASKPSSAAAETARVASAVSDSMHKAAAESTKTAAPAAAPGVSQADSVRTKIAFANRVLSAFSYGLPPDLEFTDITIDSFRTVSATGMISSREGAEKFFASLPQKKFNLLPPPHSYIRPNGPQGFRFRVESSVSFGPEADKTFVPVSPENLRTAVAGLSDLFAKNGLSLRHPIVATAVLPGCNCRGYALSGSGAYSDFVAFVRDAYNRSIPCAFRSVRLKAAENGKVEIDAEIAFFMDKQPDR